MRADPAREEALRRLLKHPPGRVEHDEDERRDGRSLARDLVVGVRRHLATLDSVLGAYTRQPVGTLDAEIREAFRLGIFQLLFHADTPPALVVASTADLGGRSAKRRGFLNAVLRKIAAEAVHEDAPPAPPRSREIVLTLTGRVARFPRPVLPDPEEDLARHLATQYALRVDFVRALEREIPLEIDAALAACNRPLPLALRVNRRRATVDEADAALRAAGAAVLRRLDGVIEARAPGPPGELKPLVEGVVTVQDLTASEVAPFVGPKPGEKILDACAGVGGKTCHMAELAEGRAEIIACDPSAERSARLAENVKRLGVGGVTAHQLQRHGDPFPPGPFDRVLVDAPCSNSGVLMKRVEARHRLTEGEVARMAELQVALLERAAPTVKPGGALVYSTCSVLPVENAHVVREFMNRAAGAGFALDEERLRYPHRTTRDGGYMARLVRG